MPGEGRERDWIRATASDSEPRAMLHHNWNENCCLQSLSEAMFVLHKEALCARGLSSPPFDANSSDRTLTSSDLLLTSAA